ncbi:MAG: hypothetical protein ACI8PT_000280 [Gammaproteobacteria bacterium]|jgi:hypothetical protein
MNGAWRYHRDSSAPLLPQARSPSTRRKRRCCGGSGALGLHPRGRHRARHRGNNGYCTHIGNDQVAYFAKTAFISWSTTHASSSCPGSLAQPRFVHPRDGRSYPLSETGMHYGYRPVWLETFVSNSPACAEPTTAPPTGPSSDTPRGGGTRRSQMCRLAQNTDLDLPTGPKLPRNPVRLTPYTPPTYHPTLTLTPATTT